MPIVVIIVMCAVALGVSFSRISALRARNKQTREMAQKSESMDRTDVAVQSDVPQETFADFLDAENASTLTRAQMDEWRRDFVLACKYGRRPLRGKAPFLLFLQTTGFSLPYKSGFPQTNKPRTNKWRLPQQKNLTVGGKASYKEYIKSGEPAQLMR